MVSINYAFREVSCKIVYYGPGLSGKTTNLQYVHKKVPTQVRGELISLATDTDRTLFFDFLPLNLGAVQGFSTKFQLYTVPGQVFYNATRKLVLRGVDGLVFVADCQLSKMEENKESLNNLMENLKTYGYQLEEIPFIIQYNKRDLPELASIEQLQEALNHWNVPYYEAVAVNGIGVFDTLKGICKMVIENLKAKTQITPQAETGPEPVAAAVPKPVSPPVEKSVPLAREIDTTEVIPSQIRQKLEPVLTPAAAEARPASQPEHWVGSSPFQTMQPRPLEPQAPVRPEPRVTPAVPNVELSTLRRTPVMRGPDKMKSSEASRPKKSGLLVRFIKFLFGA